MKNKIDKSEKTGNKEEKRVRMIKIISKIALVVPFIIGVMGYLALNPTDYSNALYFALRLYSMNFDYEVSSLMLELARWSALAATTSVIFVVLKKLYKRFYIQIMLLFTKKLTLIYGDNLHSKILEKDLKKQKIRCAITEEIFNTPKPLTHVIMFENQDDNLKFFCQNSDKFAKDSKVHIWLDKFESHILNKQEITPELFSVSQIIAQKFWMDNFKKMYDLAVKKPVVNIALIGTGIHIEKLLEYAVQFNVYTLDQEIQYHVFGDLKDFQDLHFSLPVEKHEAYNKVSIIKNDTIYFYNEGWKANAKLFQEMNNIIICDSEKNNFEVYSDLAMYVTNERNLDVCILSELGKILNETLFKEGECYDKNLPGSWQNDGKNKLLVFGNIHEVLSSEQLINSPITQRAKDLNYYYTTCFARNDELANMTVDGSWGALSDFHKESNIYTAAYWLARQNFIQDVKLQIIDQEKADKEKMIDIENYRIENAEVFAELGHISWLRFHLMHNWVFNEQRNTSKRHHNFLIEYHELDDYQKENSLISVIAALKEHK